MDRTYKEKEIGKILLGSILLFGIVELALIKMLFPAYYTHYMLFIPVYFLMLSVGMLFMLSQIKRKAVQPRREIALLMLFNASQMLLSLILVFCYYLLIKVQRISMLIAFFIFYLFFLGLKLFALYHMDKLHKAEKKAAI